MRVHEIREMLSGLKDNEEVELCIYNCNSDDNCAGVFTLDPPDDLPDYLETGSVHYLCGECGSKRPRPEELIEKYEKEVERLKGEQKTLEYEYYCFISAMANEMGMSKIPKLQKAFFDKYNTNRF